MLTFLERLTKGRKQGKIEKSTKEGKMKKIYIREFNIQQPIERDWSEHELRITFEEKNYEVLHRYPTFEKLDLTEFKGLKIKRLVIEKVYRLIPQEVRFFSDDTRFTWEEDKIKIEINPNKKLDLSYFFSAPMSPYLVY